MSEIDYNDGNWHGWNGGECPVDGNADVRIKFADSVTPALADKAGLLRWTHIGSTGDIIEFQVVKPPREWFVNEYEDGFIGLLRSSENEAFNCVSDAHGQLVRTIRVREVLE